jgi:hypothetical protein
MTATNVDGQMQATAIPTELQTLSATGAIAHLHIGQEIPVPIVLVQEVSANTAAL